MAIRKVIVFGATGMVPRRATTSGKPQLLGVTKRGSRYLRKLLMPTPRKIETRLSAWLRGLLARTHINPVVVTLAAMLARIVWALLRHKRTYSHADLGGLNGSIGDRWCPICLREARERWPDSQPLSWNPMAQNGT